MELSKPKLNACLALKVAKSVPLEKIATIVNKIYFGVRVRTDARKAVQQEHLRKKKAVTALIAWRIA